MKALGGKKGLEDAYHIYTKILGEGAFGSVRRVKHKASCADLRQCELLTRLRDGNLRV